MLDRLGLWLTRSPLWRRYLAQSFPGYVARRVGRNSSPRWCPARTPPGVTDSFARRPDGSPKRPSRHLPFPANRRHSASCHIGRRILPRPQSSARRRFTSRARTHTSTISTSRRSCDWPGRRCTRRTLGLPSRPTRERISGPGAAFGLAPSRRGVPSPHACDVPERLREIAAPERRPGEPGPSLSSIASLSVNAPPS